MIAHVAHQCRAKINCTVWQEKEMGDENETGMKTMSNFQT